MVQGSDARLVVYAQTGICHKNPNSTPHFAINHEEIKTFHRPKTDEAPRTFASSFARRPPPAYNPHARTRLQKVRAIYPGSFDPTTNGHLDVIARAARIFDHLVVAVLNNSEKSALFSVPERVEMLSESVQHIDNVSVATFNGLMVDFARQQQAQAVVRGIRAISDYEYEFQMALMNRRLAPELETVFMMPAEKYSYVSSRLIKEVFSLGGSVDGLVPPKIVERLRERAKRNLGESEGEI
jgi:pantetheine-phosphate adenylyltransferase